MDPKITEYIKRQESPQKQICNKLRKIIFKILPETKEEMKWGVPAYEDGQIYFVALKDHVNLGFAVKGLSKEEKSLLQGSGKTVRHIEIDSPKNLDEKKIIKLLKIIIKTK